MATNLVSLVSQFLTPDAVGSISSALGLERGKAQSAIAAAVPSLLAGLGSAVSRPDGAQKVADAIRQQSGSLDSIASMLGTGRQTALVDKGSQLLSSLFGGRTESALADAVGSFSGIGRGAASSLLGMLTPIVVGGVAKQLGDGFDLHSIKNLLAGQKSNIAAALPAGFASQLAGTDILDSVGDAVAGAGTAGAKAARAASAAATSTAYAAADASRRAAASTSRWLYWAIPALVLAAIGVWLYSSIDTGVERGVQMAASLPQGIVVQGVDVGRTITESLSGVRTTLTSITDVTSAQNALPRLREITAQVDRVTSLEAQLTPEQRSALAEMVRPGIASWNDVSQRVLAIPGVSDVLKPTLDSLTQKLTALAS